MTGLFYAAAIVLMVAVTASFAAPSTSTRPALADPLEVGDRLRVSVPDLLVSGQTIMLTPMIDGDGKIGLLSIKPVAAAGLTADQLADNIAQAYSDAHLISNADVKVERIEHLDVDMLPRSTLRAGDSLTVRIWGFEAPGTETKLSRSLDDQGTISLPHLDGRLRLAELTERDAARAVANNLKMQNPSVNAQVEVVRTSRRSAPAASRH